MTDHDYTAINDGSAQTANRTLIDGALAARKQTQDAADRRAVENFLARAKVGMRLLRDLTGIETDLTDWQPFSHQQASVEVDGVFLTTGCTGHAYRDVLHFWRTGGETGIDKQMEVRNLSMLGTFIERYGIDYRPETARAKRPVQGASNGSSTHG